MTTLFRTLGIISILGLSLLVTSCAIPTREWKRETTPPVSGKKGLPYVEQGIASWYGTDFHGNATASGEIYDMYQMTAAHNTLPLGTYCMVTNLDNHRSVEVKINDRGPFVKGRLIDLSYAAAREIGMVGPGTARVEVVAREMSGPPLSRPPTYTVQVGSFSDKSNANYLLEKLRQSFDEAYMTILDANQNRYYRVRIGRFETREMAYRMAQKVASLGYAVLITSR
jgi:rare lipoprotein A